MNTEKSPTPTRPRCLCEGGSLTEWALSDIARYSFAGNRDGRRPRFRVSIITLLSHGLWAILGYRAAHYARHRTRLKMVGRPFTSICYLWQRFIHLFTGIEIDPGAHIGLGLMIPHSGYIVIGPARLGHHCNVAQGVTIGRSTTEADPSRPELPSVGDRVWIGPNAVIAGRLRIGSDAVVSANSVVVRDVPDRATVQGVPATAHAHRRGSFRQVAYPGMDDDLDRARSVKLAS